MTTRKRGPRRGPMTPEQVAAEEGWEIDGPVVIKRDDDGRLVAVEVVSDDALYDLRAAWRAVCGWEEEVEHQVVIARRRGAPWADIADVFGLSRQAVAAKYGPLVGEAGS